MCGELTVAAIFLVGVVDILGAGFNCSFSPAVPVTLGTANASLVCDYSVDSSQSESIGIIFFQIRRPPSVTFFTIFRLFNFPTPTLSYVTNAVSLDFKSRVRPNFSNSSGKLTFPEVMCRDNAEYRMQMDVYKGTKHQGRLYDSVMVTIQVPSRHLRTLTVSPTGRVKDGTAMSYSCSAFMGKPGGEIKWHIHQTWHSSKDITFLSTITNSTPDSVYSCVEVKTSLLRFIARRPENHAVVQCSLEQSLLPQALSLRSPRLLVSFDLLTRKTAALFLVIVFLFCLFMYLSVRFTQNCMRRDFERRVRRDSSPLALPVQEPSADPPRREPSTLLNPRDTPSSLSPRETLSQGSRRKSVTFRL